MRAVDEPGRRVFFTANLESPIDRQLYSVSLDAPAAKPARITRDAGWHNVAMAPDASVFVDTHSTADRPKSVTLRRQSGETLAVLYGDVDGPVTEAHATFAQLLVRHATVIMSRLTQELKLLKELRDYAAMLLQEAEQMFLADLDAARPAHESIRRLRDTVECGRQLYAQRAALEGSAAAGLFDEQVALVISAQASAFAEALAAATKPEKARRTAS